MGGGGGFRFRMDFNGGAGSPFGLVRFNELGSSGRGPKSIDILEGRCLRSKSKLSVPVEVGASEVKSFERICTLFPLNLKGIPDTRSASTTTLSPTAGSAPTTVLNELNE